MSYTLDPELVPVLAALAQQASGAPARARGDWKALRESGNAGQAYMASLVPPVPGIRTATYFATAPDGTAIELRWYTTGAAPQPGPAVVYAHGGGMVLGSLGTYDTLLSWYTARSGVPFLSVGYRLAPEATGTMLAEDVFAGLAWLAEHAHEVGVDRARIAVMGDSGGGAPAAAILARDRRVPLARQILVDPMLDDRSQTPDPAREPFLDTGDLDLFRDEDISYAQRLAAAGVPVELHVRPGVPHGWDRIAPQSQAAQRAFTDRIRTIAGL